jgi:hypothetical protein
MRTVEVAVPAGSAVAVPAPARLQTRAGLWLYPVGIFVSAFLLFQIQLIISKYILPWFGGTAAVWTTAMLFFQLLLLAGYGYPHLISTRLSSRSQVRLHIILLAAAVLFLGWAAVHWRTPVMPGSDWKPLDPDFPVWRILRLLTAAVGLPFLMLSATSPLLQAWFARVYPNVSPYRLYALSNVGSLLGLVTYPFIVEPRATISAQGWMWSLLFVLFAGCCCGCGWLTRTALVSTRRTEEETNAALAANPSKLAKCLWLALPAAACCMLLAVTNKICQDIAVIPFLWVLPLVLYLLSFIICFERPGWYRREIFHPLYGAAMLLLATVLLEGASGHVLAQVSTYLFALFAVCMICHGELVRLRPAKTHMTSFYFLVASGGAMGGLFVGLVAPQIFGSWWELHVAIALSMLLLVLVLMLERSSWLRCNPYWIPPLLLAVIAIFVFHPQWRPIVAGTTPGKAYCIVLIVIAIPSMAGFIRREPVSFGGVSMLQVCVAAVAVLVGASLILNIRREGDDRVGGGRNFFGAVVLMESLDHAALGLRHGATMHGFQVKHLPMSPTAYYTPQSGIGRLLSQHPRRESADPSLRVGVIGLGVGTLAAYSVPGDYFRIYEINPLVAEYSSGTQPKFTFLKNARGKVDVVLGDGRLSLEHEADLGKLQRFDVLVLDAFSSDAIPVHLLTKEAMELYLRHLRGPESIVAVHLTNKTLDLRPVVLGLCRHFGLGAVLVSTIDNYSNEWVLLSRDARALALPQLQVAARPLGGQQLLWTDDFSNLYQVLRH